MEGIDEEICDDEASYSAMKEDPEYLLSYLDKYVTVQLLKDRSLLGFVHTIDPVTFSVILLTPEGDSFKTVIIPGHAVLDVIVTPIPEGIIPPSEKQQKPTLQEDTEEMLLRKKKLMSWFKKNLLPVTEHGKDIVIGSASVLPPYGSMDIYAENPVVATQIRKILDAMPANFN